MDTLLFTAKDKETIWSVLAAVLHLGNVTFTDQRHPDVDDEAKVTNMDTLAFASQLIGCDSQVRDVIPCCQGCDKCSARGGIFGGGELGRGNPGAKAWNWDH